MRHRSFLVAGSTHRLYLPSLDGARGLAILLVMLDHLSSAKIIPLHCLRGIGHIGVYLFFSLSAFLLTVPFWLKSKESLMQSKTWSIYFWRRFLRIYPLYIFVLIAERYTGTGFSWASIGNHLLLRRGEGVFWTLEIEAKYYVILPLIVLTFIVAWRRNATLGAICAFGLTGFLFILFYAEGRWWSLDGHVLRPYFLVFILGSIAGSLFAFMILCPPRSRSLRWCCEVAAIGAFVSSFFPLPEILRLLPKALTPGWHESIVLSGLFWAVFILAHLHGVGFVKHLLEWKPLRYLGLISYSLYLWHKPVIDSFSLVNQSGRLPLGAYWPVRTIAILGACIMAASLSFFLVERPFSKLKAGFTRSL